MTRKARKGQVAPCDFRTLSWCLSFAPFRGVREPGALSAEEEEKAGSDSISLQAELLIQAAIVRHDRGLYRRPAPVGCALHGDGLPACPGIGPAQARSPVPARGRDPHRLRWRDCDPAARRFRGIERRRRTAAGNKSKERHPAGRCGAVSTLSTPGRVSVVLAGQLWAEATGGGAALCAHAPGAGTSGMRALDCKEHEIAQEARALSCSS